MKLPPGVTQHQWSKVRREVLRWASVCERCGRPLDFTAPGRSRWAPSVDHRLSLKAMRLARLDPAEQARMALDPSNLAVLHYGCNASKGWRRLRPVQTRSASRAW